MRPNYIFFTSRMYVNFEVKRVSCQNEMIGEKNHQHFKRLQISYKASESAMYHIIAVFDFIPIFIPFYVKNQ